MDNRYFNYSTYVAIDIQKKIVADLTVLTRNGATNLFLSNYIIPINAPMALSPRHTKAPRCHGNGLVPKNEKYSSKKNPRAGRSMRNISWKIFAPPIMPS